MMPRSWCSARHPHRRRAERSPATVVGHGLAISDLFDFTVSWMPAPPTSPAGTGEALPQAPTGCVHRPKSYFHRFRSLSHEEVTREATSGKRINEPNLLQNVLPAVARRLVLRKGAGSHDEQRAAEKALASFRHWHGRQRRSVLRVGADATSRGKELAAGRPADAGSGVSARVAAAPHRPAARAISSAVGWSGLDHHPHHRLGARLAGRTRPLSPSAPRPGAPRPRSRCRMRGMVWSTSHTLIMTWG
jgi:hypothetical protein